MRFDQARPQPRQTNAWGCLPNSLAWSLEALGHQVDRASFGLQVVRDRIITPRGYLADKGGTEIAAWAADRLAGYGLASLYVFDAPFDDVAAEAGLYGLVIGSGSWLHYSAVRDYDAARDVLLLANSSPGWQRIGQTMTRLEYRRYQPISLTRIATPEIIGQIGEHVEHDRRRGVSRPQDRRTLYLPRVGEGRTPGPVAGPGVLRRTGPGDPGDLGLFHQLRRQPAAGSPL